MIPEKLFRSLLLISFLMIIGAIILQIVARYVFNAPLSWTEELSLLAFCWFTFTGSAVSSYRNNHLEIDYFHKKWPPAIKKFMDLSIELLTAGLALFLVIDSFQTLLKQKGMSSMALRIPISLYTLAIAIGFAGIGFFTVRRIINLCK